MEKKKYEEDTFAEEFFDSEIYKEIIACNFKKGIYLVRTSTNQVFLIDRETNSCVELHFPEEILLAIKECE